MGTSFVSLETTDDENEIGFWMRDSVLELWLRLLALHVPEPDRDNRKLSYEIRNHWLLASQIHFNGCVPHMLEDDASTEEGRVIIRAAIHSLLPRLQKAPPILNEKILDLPGFEESWNFEFETFRLIEVGEAFLALLDGKLTCTVRETNFMPGCK